MSMPGSELYFDSRLDFLGRLYCRLLGVPIVGLRIRIRRLRQILPDHASRVLDAGCGRGVITRFLSSRFPDAEVHAVDADLIAQTANREISEKAGFNNCNFIDADLTEYSNTDHYDLVVSVDNLEHVLNDRLVLQNFFESLKTSGVLVVHVPHFYRRWPVLAWQTNFDVPGHVRPGYHMAQLVERVEQAGFVVDKKGFSYGFLENLTNNISYWISGAEEKNRVIYALLFPILNFFSWLGSHSKPKFGAGVWLVATKPEETARKRKRG
jgi:2-polyprenyl-3-methyl-5-hydroxy-6-metoxy-1,4-benzoquinol methylase